MGAGITLWGRAGEAETQDAQAFLRANRYGADRVLDIERDPPRGDELHRLRKALGGSLRPAADFRSREARDNAVAPEIPEDGLEHALLAGAIPWRTPILLTPKGAVCGFRERKWREFLDIGHARS